MNEALMACAEVNADPHSPVRLDPLVIDPGCELSAYAAGVKTMFDRGIRQVVGCYTSSSRKEVIPIFEKCDALLWYPTHYEGFESSANVVYTGTAPNHHLSPLIDYLVSRFGRRAFCIGSNYIWGWESNRVLREDITQRGGTVLAERYLALGDTDFRSIIEAIFDSGPDFVFNALVGRSAYAFFREFRAACTARGIDQKSRYPIASCNLSEPERSEIGLDAIDGHLSSSVYFSSIDTPINRAFVAGYNRMFPEGPAVSAEAEAAYIATKFLAVALVEAGTDELQSVKAAVRSKAFDAPQGRVTIDPETMHAYLMRPVCESACRAGACVIPFSCRSMRRGRWRGGGLGRKN